MSDERRLHRLKLYLGHWALRDRVVRDLGCDVL